MYEFWYVKPKYREKNNTLLYCYTQFHCIRRSNMIFIKTLQKMLKQDLTLQIKSWKSHY